MSVTVIPMRKRGVPINPHMREAGEFVGDLYMYNYTDPVLHRNVSRVDLVVPNQPGGRKDPMLPGLHDVALVTLGNDRLMLTGFERLPIDGGRQADYAQSWWVLLRT
jgi:hypothetical protein